MSGAAHSDYKNPEYRSESNNTDKTQDIINVGSILIAAIKAQITETEFRFPENTDF